MGSFASFILVVMLATIVALGLLCAIMYRLKHATLAIGVMFFLSSISIILDYFKHVYQTWLLPLQSRRAELFGVMGIVLFVGALPHYRQLSLRRITGHGWMLIVMGLYAGFLRMFHISIDDGGQSIMLVLATMFPLALVAGGILREPADCERLMKVLVWTWFVWTLGCAVQFVVDRRLLLLGVSNLFTGLIGNPNQAATVIAVVATMSLWLGFNGHGVLRPVYIALTGLYLIELVWTGSRGAMGMFILGASAVLYGRLGKMVLLMPLFAVAVYGALRLTQAAGIDVWTGKLLATNNSRAETWAAMIATIKTFPLFGAGTTEAGGSESSYLVGWASYGVFMFLMILVLTGIGVLHTMRLYWVRGRAGRDERALIDLCIGQQIGFFAGGLLEGFMVGRVNSNMLLIVVFAAMGRMLLENVRLRAEAGVEYDEHYEDEEYGAEPHEESPLPA